MTPRERATALQAYGFTCRQASFVTMVLLHGGVCVPRQYCAFAGITRGQVMHDFFATLTARRSSVERAIERLMVLDAVLMKSDLTWLATEREKVTYCRQDRTLSEEHLPR